MSGYEPLDERYFNWLCERVGVTSRRDPAKSHTLLAEDMYKTPFEDFVPNDFNRAEDGKALRMEFLDATHARADASWLSLDCSILEMIVALAGKFAYHTNWGLSASFWLFITNLELGKYTDEKYHDAIREAVLFVLNTINKRTYEFDGRGGLFPLTDPPTDQRGVEIWYQMSAYMLENVKF